MQYCAIVALVRVNPGSTNTTAAGFSSVAVLGLYIVAEYSASSVITKSSSLPYFSVISRVKVKSLTSTEKPEVSNSIPQKPNMKISPKETHAVIKLFFLQNALTLFVLGFCETFKAGSSCADASASTFLRTVTISSSLLRKYAKPLSTNAGGHTMLRIQHTKSFIFSFFARVTLSAFSLTDVTTKPL